MNFFLSKSSIADEGFAPKKLARPGFVASDFVRHHRWKIDKRLVHVVWDFRPWDVMTKVHYFLMIQIYDLRTLEVEHDLETCQRP
jgi:hypothetical protein